MGTNEEEEHSLMIGDGEAHLLQNDPKRNRFPCCIVWTPLPLLSWFVPFIGHIGICREDGVILDFAGPNFVCVDNFAFGAPRRFVRINKEKCCIITSSAVPDSSHQIDRGRDIVTWDDALRKSTQEYQNHSYNIFTCNCHSFVANCLNRLKFHAGGWNVVKLAVFIFLKGEWVSKAAIVRTYLPFIIVLGLGLTFGGLSFLAYLAIFLLVLVGWFVVGTYCFKNLITL